MAANREETIKLVAAHEPTFGGHPDARVHPAMPMMSRDLRFQPKALEVLASSFVELNILPAEPDMKTLYTEEFLPPRSESQEAIA